MKALVISGGGAKGAYAVGALQHIVGTLGLTFDLVAGTSTGGLIAPLVLTDDVEVLADIYTSVSTDDVLEGRGWGRAVRASSLNKVDPLARIINRHITQDRVDRILAASQSMFITTIHLQSQKTVYFHTHPAPRVDPEREALLIPITDRDMMRRAVLATACIPFFMPPVRIPSGSRQQYLDGGVRDVVPVQIAIENGATEIYVIVMTPRIRPIETREFRNLLIILQKTIDVFSREVLLNDVRQAARYSKNTQYMQALRDRIQQRFNLSDQEVRDLFDIPGVPNPLADHPEVTLHVIRPETQDEVSGGTLDFDPVRMESMRQAGLAKAIEVLGTVPPPVV